MLRLITQANLKVSRTGAVNLRLVDSVPNFAIPQNVVSQGFLANLKCLLTERGERIPGGANESEFLPQDFRASFVDNLKECLRPTPKLTGDAAYSLRGAASPGIKIESLPLYLSIFRNIRDRVIPPKLPPLELTSKPIEVPEIWSKHRRLSGANVVSLVLHVSFTLLMFVFTVRQVKGLDPAKPVTVLIPPPAPGAPIPPPRGATPTVIRPVAYSKHKSLFATGKVIAPNAIPKGPSAKRSIDDVGAPDLNAGGDSSDGPPGMPGGVLGGESGGIPGGILGGISGVPPPPPGAIAPIPGLVRVGGNIKRPKEIYAPAPEFPSVARHAKITGVVLLDAVIDEHGNVVKLHAVKGNGLLIDAALKAVAQWRYEPTYLDGVPVAVEMEVEVDFYFSD